MLKVKKIVGNVLSSNMYILFEEGTTDCWVIDIGDFYALKKELLSFRSVKGLFITHGHFDHIFDINLFHSEYPNCSIYISNYGKEQLYSEKKNFSLYHERPIVFQGNESSIHLLRDGDEIKLYNHYYLKVLATPGHCKSCLTYYTINYIFTGDSYIPKTKVVTKLPQGDKFKAEESMINIKIFSEGRIICPGHEVMTKD